MSSYALLCSFTILIYLNAGAFPQIGMKKGILFPKFALLHCFPSIFVSICSLTVQKFLGGHSLQVFYTKLCWKKHFLDCFEELQYPIVVLISFSNFKRDHRTIGLFTMTSAFCLILSRFPITLLKREVDLC